jgi:hypothetical protein
MRGRSQGRQHSRKRRRYSSAPRGRIKRRERRSRFHIRLCEPHEGRRWANRRANYFHAANLHSRSTIHPHLFHKSRDRGTRASLQ